MNPVDTADVPLGALPYIRQFAGKVLVGPGLERLLRDQGREVDGHSPILRGRRRRPCSRPAAIRSAFSTESGVSTIAITSVALSRPLTISLTGREAKPKCG